MKYKTKLTSSSPYLNYLTDRRKFTQFLLKHLRIYVFNFVSLASGINLKYSLRVCLTKYFGWRHKWRNRAAVLWLIWVFTSFR